MVKKKDSVSAKSTTRAKFKNNNEQKPSQYLQNKAQLQGALAGQEAALRREEAAVRREEAAVAELFALKAGTLDSSTSSPKEVGEPAEEAGGPSGSRGLFGGGDDNSAVQRRRVSNAVLMNTPLDHRDAIIENKARLLVEADIAEGRLFSKSDVDALSTRFDEMWAECKTAKESVDAASAAFDAKSAACDATSAACDVISADCDATSAAFDAKSAACDATSAAFDAKSAACDATSAAFDAKSAGRVGEELFPHFVDSFNEAAQARMF
jgi:hypothetical protein